MSDKDNLFKKDSEKDSEKNIKQDERTKKLSKLFDLLEKKKAAKIYDNIYKYEMKAIPYWHIDDIISDIEDDTKIDEIIKKSDEIIEMIDKNTKANNEINKIMLLKIKDYTILARNKKNTRNEYIKYAKAFEKYKDYYEKNTQEINENTNKLNNKIENHITHLISLVSIFTALAFIFFGGLSSLTELLKEYNGHNEINMIRITTIWGLAFNSAFYIFFYFIFAITDRLENNSKMFCKFIIISYIILIIVLIGSMLLS